MPPVFTVRPFRRPTITPPVADPLVGKSVSFMHEGTRMFGVVQSAAGGKASVAVGFPFDGKLAVTGAQVSAEAAGLTVVDLGSETRRVTVGNVQHALEGESKGVAIKDEKTNRIIDYKGVTFAGYASTFSHITESDRQGDAMKPGAFRETIKIFMGNPIMLIDHRNSVENIAGHYTTVREDDKGLWVEGMVSDAPELTSVRFHLMEKSLRTLSIGGIWMFEPDGRTISKVHLFEISLVAVPANPDAVIQARAFDIDAARKYYSKVS